MIAWNGGSHDILGLRNGAFLRILEEALINFLHYSLTLLGLNHLMIGLGKSLSSHNVSLICAQGAFHDSWTCMQGAFHEIA